MAREKKKLEGPPPPAPWMATFSDLMNLLLCFFVLLFSMSSVDAEKFQEVAASFISTFSILPNGGSAVGDGLLISNGVSQLNELSEYFSNMGLSDEGEQMKTMEEIKAVIEREELEKSEEMAEKIEQALSENEMLSDIDVEFNSQYVELRLNGAILFNSGKADIRSDAVNFMDKLGDILKEYEDCLIEVVGHTDNVPISNSKFANNTELSCFRAISVVEYLQNQKDIPAINLQPSGRGENIPIASNDTPEGRAQNRRVEIKIHRTLE